MVKRIISCLLSLAMVMTALVMPMGENLAEVVNKTFISASAKTSRYYEYEILDNGTVELTKYIASGSKVTVPSTLDGKTVTSIGDNAFRSCSTLTIVAIPTSVTNIGSYAFAECHQLEKVTIPNSIITIKNNAFMSCSSLANVTIPNGVKSIGEYAFYNTKLSSVTIPSSVTSIGKCAFYFCTSLTSIGVNSANNYYSSKDGVLFDKNKKNLIQYPIGNSRTSYSIPNTVTVIGKYSFNDSVNLAKVTIPNSVTTIETSAFNSCTKLTDITIPNSVKTIEYGAFTSCKNLVSITIPSSVASIEDSVFAYCESLKNVTLPNSIKSIGLGAFEECTSLTKISIPSSVVEIEYSAFRECSKLLNITIPNSVKSIGKFAFTDCSALTSINVNSGNPIYSSQDGVLFNKNKTELIQYPIGNTRKSYSMPNGVKSILNSSFKNCKNITSVTIPNSVTLIDDSAFDGCINMKSVTIPSSVTIVRTKAFGFYKDPKTYKSTKINGFKIKCYAGAGENYAKNNGLTYELLGNANLAKVSNFKVTKTASNSVKLSWNNVSGAEGYIIYKYDNTKKTWVRILKSTVSSGTYNISNLKAGTTYKFAIKAYKTVNGKESTSSSFPTVTATTNPSTISNFKATTTTASSVKLTWNKVSVADGYIIYKYDNTKRTWVRIGKGKHNGVYTAVNLKSGTSYKFAVKAYKTVNGKEITSSSFPTVTSTTNPSTISNFKATTTTASSVKLTWNKVSVADGYIIYKYDNTKKTWVRIGKGKHNGVYTAVNLKAGTTYKFAVKAYKTVNGKEITSCSFPTVTSTTNTATVTNFKATTSTKSSVKLTWNKISSVNGYIIYKYDNGKKTWVRIGKGKYNGTYTAVKLKSKTSYKFAIKAYKTVNGKEITSAKFPTVKVSTK